VITIEITDIRFKYPQYTDRNNIVLAIVSLEIDGAIVIKNIKLMMDNEMTKYYLIYPKNIGHKKTKNYNVVYFKTRELYDYALNIIIEAYKNANKEEDENGLGSN